MCCSHRDVFLGLCCVSDVELAAVVLIAVVFEHSVVRVISSSEDLQFVSTRRVLHCLLKICNLCYVVVDIWFLFRAQPGAHFRLKIEKLCAVTGDLP